MDKLKELTWLDNGRNIVLAGPPGLGKTMVATGLGLHAINSGYTVCFEKMVNLVKILDNAETERTAGFRLKNLKKAQLIIVDEIGYTPISRSQANRFFTFISDTYETSSIYDNSKQNYGAPKITQELRKSGETIAQRTVGKYMREMGIRAQWTKPWTKQICNSRHYEQDHEH